METWGLTDGLISPWAEREGEGEGEGEGDEWIYSGARMGLGFVWEE